MSQSGRRCHSEYHSATGSQIQQKQHNTILCYLNQQVKEITFEIWNIFSA